MLYLVWGVSEISLRLSAAVLFRLTLVAKTLLFQKELVLKLYVVLTAQGTRDTQI